MNKYIFLCLIAFCAIALSGCADSQARELYVQAENALSDGDFKTAENSYGQVIARGEYLAESYRGMGIAQIGEADYSDGAISLSKALLNADDTDKDFIRDVSMYLAYCRQMQGNTGEALKLYDELIEQDPDADLLFLRGKIYMSQNRFDLAEQDFNAAADISDDYNLYISIYETFASYRMGANGSEFLERAMSMAEDNEGDHYSRGLIYYYLQNYDDAREELIKALKEDRNDEKVMLLLGKTYLAMGDIADARAMYKEHTDDAENAADAYNGIALCDMAEENYNSALQNIEKGLEYDDEDANRSLLFNEILVYEHFRDWEKARALAEQYVRTYPLEEEGAREYEFLSTR